MQNLRLIACAAAACFAFAGPVFALSKDEYKAEKDKIGTAYKADKQKCDTLKDNAKDICRAEAKGKDSIAMAELDASMKPSPAADQKVKRAKADAAYDLAKEKCDDLKGKEKNACQKDAKAAQKVGRAEARLIKAAGDKAATAARKG